MAKITARGDPEVARLVARAGYEVVRPRRAESGLREVGAAGFEPATFRPPAEPKSVSMRPGASPASPSFMAMDDLDT
jgi:hypothetical protein